MGVQSCIFHVLDMHNFRGADPGFSSRRDAALEGYPNKKNSEPKEHDIIKGRESYYAYIGYL